MGNVIFLAVLFIGMWALLILPQQRKMKAHQALIASAKAGDRVLLASGVYGTVTEVLAQAMYVEIAEGIEILVNRSQLQEILDEFPTEEAPQDMVDADLDEEA